MGEVLDIRPESGHSRGETRTVALVFTDIEGSTGLVDSLGAAYAGVLGRHQEIIRAAATAHGGHDHGSKGDSFFLVFDDAGSALSAAVAAQRALTEEPWPKGGEVRVRMGIHVGPVTFVDDEIVGLDVHRAARISDAGHGGQILVSLEAQEALIASLGDALTVQLRPLGRHKLKGLRYPEILFGVVAAGLPQDFPDLRALTQRRDNLAPLKTAIVGRDAEVGRVVALLMDAKTRLVSLIGPGGIGKSSIARQVAETLRAEFPDGVHVVEFGGVTEPEFALPTLAQVVGVRDFPNRSLEDDLAADIGVARRLLILDTMEHVLDAAPAIGRLIDRCPGLRVLVTSRAALGLGSETVVRIGPLALPRAGMDAPEANPAVQLFVSRAREADPSFALTGDNVATVIALVQRLEGVPLALELAAARLVLLTPSELLDRLEERFKVLSSGKQDAGRHRTLRKAIEWSDDLLDEDERDGFHRLSVFTGGFRFRDGETMLEGAVATRELDAMDLIASLVDKSLVERQNVNGEPRFVMLDMIREFAVDKLRLSGTLDEMRRMHCDHFAGVVEVAGARALHVDQRKHVTRLIDELDNIRAALDFALDTDDAARAARFLRALQWYWFTQAQLTEAMEWTSRAAELAARTPDKVAAGLIHEAAAVVRMGAGDYAAGLPHANAAVAAHDAAGEASGRARAALLQALCSAATGEVEDPSPQIMDCIERFALDGDLYYGALGLIVLGEGARMAGMLEPAEECYTNALAQLEASGDTFWKGALKQNIGHFRLGTEDPDAAAALFAEAYDLGDGYDYELVRGLAVAGFAGVSLQRGDPQTAARFLGAVEATLDRIGVRFEPADAADIQRYIDGAQAALGAETYARLAAEGAASDWSAIQEEARAMGPKAG